MANSVDPEETAHLDLQFAKESISVSKVKKVK